MRIAVKGAGGVTRCFVHADHIEEAVKAAGTQVAEYCGLPVELELWTDPPAGPRHRLGQLRFVAVTVDGTGVPLD